MRYGTEGCRFIGYELEKDENYIAGRGERYSACMKEASCLLRGSPLAEEGFVFLSIGIVKGMDILNPMIQ